MELHNRSIKPAVSPKRRTQSRYLAFLIPVAVLRQGRITGQVPVEGATREGLARMMVGREVKLAPDKPTVAPGQPRLRIKGLTVTGDRGDEAIRSLDLEVRGGEILGIAGVSGNGQRELAETIGGLREPTGGAIFIDDTDVAGKVPAEVRAAGLSYVPEGRMKNGCIGEFTVAENLLLVDHKDRRFVKRGLFDFGAIKEHAAQLVKQYAVKTPTLDTTARSLSGGNIQKLILAREISGTPKVLVASQPARGVDIGAAEYIHERLVGAWRFAENATKARFRAVSDADSAAAWEASSSAAVPNCIVHSSLPRRSYARTNASRPPRFRCPFSARSVEPAT